MSAIKNIADQRFGHLTAVRFVGGVGGEWECVCVCGQRTFVRGRRLRSGHTTSCGCRDGHGHAGRGGESPTYNTWQGMLFRCENPAHRAFSRYGGRGIIVCRRWHDFKNFLADMGERPDGRTLDRINNDGNYEPGNCRWATPAEQAANKSNVRRVEWRGRWGTLAEHARYARLRYSTVRLRISRGWTLDESLTIPVGGTGREGTNG